MRFVGLVSTLTKIVFAAISALFLTVIVLLLFPHVLPIVTELAVLLWLPGACLLSIVALVALFVDKYKLWSGLSVVMLRTVILNKLIYFSILLICCGAGNVLAQEKPEFVARVEQVFKESEPTWKVEDQTVRNESGFFDQSMRLKSGKSQAVVSIRVYPREQFARDTFEGESIAYDNISAKGTIKKSLPNLGDENYVWLIRGGNAWPTIRIRKGNILIMVFAPSMIVAKRFVQHVVKELPASN